MQYVDNPGYHVWDEGDAPNLQAACKVNICCVLT